MMWIMGYNDGVESLNNIQDPLLNGRKHRPLMPRPRLVTAPPCNNLALNHNTAHHEDHLLALNHYHLAMAEHNRREQLSSTQHQVVVSSRWNPTPEQLQTLEELYRRGTRTPSAEEIQQITAQLRRYGKIEGKNVFYWFQNHKARERQKRRRQLEPSSDELPQNNSNHTYYNNNNAGVDQENVEKIDNLPTDQANRTQYEEHQQTKNWPANPSILADQETFSAQGTTTKAVCNKLDRGWAQLDVDDAELLQWRRNATWQFIPCSSSSSSPTNLINSGSVATTVTTVPSTVVRSQTDIITSSKIHQLQPINVNNARNLLDDDVDEHKEAQTLLQLFPLRSDREGRVHEQQQEQEESGSYVSTVAISPNYNSYDQFFEFLPLKN